MISKKIANDKNLFKRLAMSHWDLSQAFKFVKIVLDGNYNTDKEENTLLTALSIAIIVTYWKPFSKNKNSSDVKPRLPRKCLNEYNEEELKLHKRIKKMRDTDFAHSDPDSHGIDVYVNKMNNQNIFIPGGRNPYISMESRDLLMLKEMISKILKWISTEMQRIQNVTEVDKDF